jgi:hypothetical protein
MLLLAAMAVNWSASRVSLCALRVHGSGQENVALCSPDSYNYIEAGNKAISSIRPQSTVMQRPLIPQVATLGHDSQSMSADIAVQVCRLRNQVQLMVGPLRTRC